MIETAQTEGNSEQIKSKTELFSDHRIAALIGLVTFVVYLLTMAPTVVGGDSAELASGAHTLGMIHPPGYPLYTLIGKLFTFIPFGTIGWRVNLLSGVSDAAASALLFLVVKSWTRNRPAAVMASGIFAFSPLVWEYATVAEVFSFHNFLLATLLWVAVKVLEVLRSPTPRSNESDARIFRLAQMGALLNGLGMSHHHSYPFLALPIDIWIAYEARHFIFKPVKILTLVGWACLGLTPYIYLPIASLHDPSVNWGNASTLDGFFTHFLRREYGTFRLGINDMGPSGDFLRRFWLFVREVPRPTLIVGIPIFLYGAYRSIFAPIDLDAKTKAIPAKTSKKGAKAKTKSLFLRNPNSLALERRFSLVLASSVALHLVVFCSLSNLLIDVALHNAVQARFWQQPLMIVYMWLAYGLVAVQNLWVAQARANATAENPANVGAIGKMVWTFALLMALIPLGMNYRAENKSKDYFFVEFSKAILDSLPPHALLLTNGDFIINPLRYLQFSEGYRPDVTVVDENLLAYPWNSRILKKVSPDITIPAPGFYADNGFDMKTFIEMNQAKFPMYACNAFRKRWDQSYRQSFGTLPMGMVERIVPIGEPIILEQWMAAAEENQKRFDPTPLKAFGEETWEYRIEELYWGMQKYYSERLVNFLADKPDKPEALKSASRSLAGVADAARPSNPTRPVMYKNLGIIYQKLEKFDPSVNTKTREAWTHYLEMNPSGDPDLQNIRGYLQGGH